MIDIKFRAKAICEYESKLGEWKYGFYKSIRDQHSILVFEESKPSIGWYSYKVDSKTVGQFTGLKDKNGKEIYEGDITSLDGEYLAVIKWDEKKASFVADSIEGDCVSEHLYGAELCAVEGNIHENPELLEAD